MPLTNNLKRVVDLPIFEICNQMPTATQPISSTTTADEDPRYIYYLTGSLFYRYDSETDTWQQLASPMLAPVTCVAMKMSSYNGYRGNCLSATTNTMTVPGLSGDILKNKTIKITSGLGVGQERTITGVSATTIYDQGIATAASNVLITDTTKRWEINQYIGYQVRIVFNTGSSQVRKVLYNDASTLYFYDQNYQQLETWNNTYFSAIAPYAAPVAAAGSQANYIIESCDITVNTNWDIIPDETSSFTLFSRGIWLISAIAAAPFSSFQYYDVLSDTWTIKTALGGLLLAALGTDLSLERTSRAAGNFLTGTATSTTIRTLTNTTLSGVTALVIDDYVGFQLRITAGTGLGQRKRITANGTNYFEVNSNWNVTPDNTSVYEIYGDTDKIYLNGNGSSQMYIYHVEHDTWTTGEEFECGQARGMTCLFGGQEAYAITTAVRSITGITVLNSTPTAGGTGYAVGDLFNITTGGTVGKGRVETITLGGVVTSVSLYSAGTGYTTGAGKVTTIISGTGNNGLTVNITTIGTVARVTLATNANLYKEDTITITGSNDAVNWDKSYTILAIDSLTTFDIVITASASIVTLRTNSVTEIVDATKNWLINEHIGKLVILNTFGPSPTTQTRRIISNTATSVTVATIVAAANGTSRYSICDPNAFGIDLQWKTPTKQGRGAATSGSSTTLVDNTKNWFINQWIGYKVRILAGAGAGSEVGIIGNDATTLTLYTPGFTPDTSTRYLIMDTFGIVNGAGAIRTIALVPTAGGTGYAIGDLLNITGGNAQARVLAVNGSIVTAIGLAFGGVSGYSVVAGVATTNLIGTGTGCTVNVTAITVIASTTTLEDNTKNWTINQWAGKRLIITSGTGSRQELIISSNTTTILTFSVAVAPDVTSTYSILSIANRSLGTQLNWVFGSSTLRKGRYIISQRGGATNTIDIYDIVTGTWNITYFMGPQTETFTTGTMTAYDGGDYLYIQKDAVGRIFEINVNNMAVSGALQLTDLHAGAVVGNRMEIITNADGLKYLYIMQHTGTKMWRALIF